MFLWTEVLVFKTNITTPFTDVPESVIQWYKLTKNTNKTAHILQLKKYCLFLHESLNALKMPGIDTL